MWDAPETDVLEEDSWQPPEGDLLEEAESYDARNLASDVARSVANPMQSPVGYESPKEVTPNYELPAESPFIAAVSAGDDATWNAIQSISDLSRSGGIVINPNAAQLPQMNVTTRGGPPLQLQPGGMRSVLNEVAGGIGETLSHPGIFGEESAIPMATDFIPQPTSTLGQVGVGAAQGVEGLIRGVVDFFTSGSGIAQLGAAASPAAPAVYAKWAVDMARGGYTSAQDAIEDFKKSDWQSLSKNIVTAFGMFLGAKGAVKHGFKIAEAKALDYTPRGAGVAPKKSLPPLSQQEETKRRLELDDAQAEDLYQLQEAAKEGPLSPEEAHRLGQLKQRDQVATGETKPVKDFTAEHGALWDEVTEEMGAETERLEGVDPSSPASGSMVTGINRETGKVVVNPENLSAVLDSIKDPEARRDYVRSLISEEQAHLATPNEVARAFYDDASGVEKFIGRRRYTKTWSGKLHDRELNDTDVGHEMIRMHMQRIRGMTPTEIAYSVGTGKGALTAKALVGIERAVFATRKKLGTKASKRQIGYLDEVANNIKEARTILSGGAQSQPQSPNYAQREDVGNMKPEEFMDVARGWSKDAMAGKGSAMQSRAEIAASHEPNLAVWDESLKKANAESEVLKGQVKASPQLFSNPEFGKRFAGAMQRTQFFSEGRKIINGERQPLPETIKSIVGTLTDDGVAGNRRMFTPKEGPAKNAQFSVPKDATPAEIVKKYVEHSKVWAEESSPQSPRYGMSKKAQELAEQSRRIREMQARARGEELPEELRTKKAEAEFPPVPTEERVGMEAGGVFAPSAKQVSENANQAMQMEVKRTEKERTEKQIKAGHIEWERPSFKSFVKSFDKKGWGKSMQPAQLRQAWEDAVWSHVIKAEPGRLESLRKSLGLEHNYGAGPIAHAVEGQKNWMELKGEAGEKPTVSNIAFELAGQVGDKVLARQQKLTAESKQRYRSKVVSAIARKLITESMEGRAELNRSEIGVDDVAFSNEKTKFGVYHEITRDDIAEPKRLNAILRDQWRGSSVDPETASRRVVAVVDGQGRVSLLSTYNDGGVQRIVEPSGTLAGHRPFRELNKAFLNQYRPFASLLLNDPVKGLRQKFESVSEFNDKIGEEAKNRSEIGESGHAAEGPPAEDFEAEGTPGIEGEGGGFMGPKRGVLPGESRRPVLKEPAKLTAREAGSVVDQLMDTVGKLESVDDVHEAIADLQELAKNRGLSITDIPTRGKKLTTKEMLASKKQLAARDLAAINAYRKIFKKLEADDPNASVKELTDRMAQKVFDLAAESRTGDDFAQKLLSELGVRTKTDSLTHKSELGRELAMRGDIRPPTSQRAFQGPFQREEAPSGELGSREPGAYIPESMAVERPIQTEAEHYKQREYGATQDWAAAFRNKAAVGEAGRKKAMQIRSRIYRKQGVLPSKAEAAKLAGYEGPMSPFYGKRELDWFKKTGLKILSTKLTDKDSAHESLEQINELQWKLRDRMQELGVNFIHDDLLSKDLDYSKVPTKNLQELRDIEHEIERLETIFDQVHEKAEEAGLIKDIEDSSPQSPFYGKKKAGAFVSNAIKDTMSFYDEWMVDRMVRHGGDVAEQAGAVFRHAIDREKELYGSLTPLLDKARTLAGGTVPAAETPLKILGKTATGIIGQVPTPKAIKAVNWVNGITPIKGAKFGGTWDGVEVFDFPKNVTIPAFAQKLVAAAKIANIETGRMIEKVIPGFKATGKFQRNINATGYDVIREGRGDMWRKWTAATAKANGMKLVEVRDWFRTFKETLDTPGVDSSAIEKLNQDFNRVLPKVVTHIKSFGQWQPVVHADLFNYLENSARRATHATAFREQFPNTVAGRKKLQDVKEAVRNEMGAAGQDSLESMIRTMQGIPTDNYTSYGMLGPTRPAGQVFRYLNNTVGTLMSKMALTGQMIVQPGENIAGSIPVFLGYKNYLRGLARVKELYPHLEITGDVNKAIYDFSWNKNSKIRSLFRITGNTISKVFAEQALNELQEAGAAATAHVVAERIKAGTLSKWEERMLPETFQAMGFPKDEVSAMMLGEPALLAQFERKASAFLTSGNRAISEGSALGANRLFNSVFRFQSYPMMKANQLRKVTSRLVDAWIEGDGKDKKQATEMFSRFMFGNTLQGALTVGITTVLYGGVMGLKIRSKEAQDEPALFLAESFLSTVSGPLYLAWNSMKYKGVAGFSDAGARIVFPYAVVSEMTDMATGKGRYRDRDTFSRIGEFLRARTPATKAIGQGLALVGLSHEDKKLDAALDGFYRWRRDAMGFDERRSFLNKDELAKFRVQMRKAIEALKVGDAEKFSEAYMAAAQEKKELGRKGGVSFTARKVLKNAVGGKLTPDEMDALRKHIGDDAVDRLEYFDLMLENAGKGQMTPKYDE